MKDLYFLNKKAIEYKDIINELNFPDSSKSYFEISRAYIKNGFVFMDIAVRKGWNGVYNEIIIPQKYRPVEKIFGVATYHATGSDNGKIQNFFINSSGQLYIWVRENLNNDEPVQIMYPLNI